MTDISLVDFCEYDQQDRFRLFLNRSLRTCGVPQMTIGQAYRKRNGIIILNVGRQLNKEYYRMSEGHIRTMMSIMDGGSKVILLCTEFFPDLPFFHKTLKGKPILVFDDGSKQIAIDNDMIPYVSKYPLDYAQPIIKKRNIISDHANKHYRSTIIKPTMTPLEMSDIIRTYNEHTLAVVHDLPGAIVACYGNVPIVLEKRYHKSLTAMVRDCILTPPTSSDNFAIQNLRRIRRHQRSLPTLEASLLASVAS